MRTKRARGQGTAASGRRFAIVVSRYHEAITTRLLDGAMKRLRRAGCAKADVLRVDVPGAFEIPLAAKRLAESQQFAAVICLGCVIRGETPHFDYVAEAAARGVLEVGLSTGVPTTFGVLTVDSMEQATDRAGGSAGNKGEEAAQAALELAAALARIDEALYSGSEHR